MFVKALPLLSDQLLSQILPQQTEGGVGNTVFPNGCILLVVVISAPSDVKGKAFKIFRQSGGADDL